MILDQKNMAIKLSTLIAVPQSNAIPGRSFIMGITLSALNASSSIDVYPLGGLCPPLLTWINSNLKIDK